MKTHDPTQWSRRDHYRWYRGLEFPYLGITAKVDGAHAGAFFTHLEPTGRNA